MSYVCSPPLSVYLDFALTEVVCSARKTIDKEFKFTGKVLTLSPRCHSIQTGTRICLMRSRVSHVAGSQGASEKHIITKRNELSLKTRVRNTNMTTGKTQCVLMLLREGEVTFLAFCVRSLVYVCILGK